ncbi:MAG: glycosyltransferase [Thiobacillus sp.]|nr:glycosyltransferase [Thiobacillus sp.]
MTSALAPVALFTYKRPDHTKATLEALARNTAAAQTNLFVFSDGPKDANDSAAVAAVRGLVRSVTGFAAVTLIERPSNMGLARSVITGVSELLEKNDRVIVLEDDLVTSQNFLAYMNDALDHYRDDPAAFSVTGHTFPEPYLHTPKDYPFDTYASFRCSSWSWGTWRDRWQKIDWEMDYFMAFCQDAAAQNAFNRGGHDMSAMLRLQHEGKIDSWAIRFCYAHHANDMRCMYPTKTLVRNIGLDNSGTHSKPEPRFHHARLDETWRPMRFCPAEHMDQRITQSFRSVFDPPEPTRVQLFNRKIRSLIRLVRHYGYALLQRIKRALFPLAENVDILVVNSFQRNGGAARAAWRIYLGIRSVYPQAKYLTLIKDDLRADVVGRYQWSFKGLLAMRLASLDRLPMARYPHRQPVTFTPAAWANALRVPLSRFKPRLVHLHWLASSLLRIEELGRLRVPIVWTLHDTWAFTGGCHYTGNCDGFRAQCGSCPQLGSIQDTDLSHAIWHRKRNAYAQMDLTVVAPSHWLADVARQSGLFAGRRIEVIPNGLDTDVFQPLDKGAAKSFLGIDLTHPVLLFGAQWLTDRRKGGDLLAAALARLDFPCTLLTFGEGVFTLDTHPNITVRALGTLHDDISLAAMYSAADLFICPSREDNLPNTVAEALACGTPCAAFDINGLPDMIEHKKTGWLAKPFDIGDLAKGIRWLAQHPNPKQLQQAARDKATAEFSMSVMTQRYDRLYSELLKAQRN